MIKAITIFTFAILGCFTAYAQDGMVGFEWTFTNLEIINSSKPQTHDPEMPDLFGISPRQDLFYSTPEALHNSPWNRARQAWIAEINRHCPNCAIDKNKVTLPDGFWFKIISDGPVLEVLTQPMTLQQLSERQDILESLVWRASKKVGLLPDKRLGGGHLHLDIKSHFGDDRRLFRNFVVDLMNRPELFMGGFGLNYFNAPPLAFYGSKAIKGFKKLIKAFDADESISIEDFMEKMNDFYRQQEHPIIPTPYAKFQALNFKHTVLGTLEARGVRPQVSAEHARRLVAMFQGRINSLKNDKKLIKVRVPDLSDSFSSTRENSYRHYFHKLSPQIIFKAIGDFALAAKLPRDFYDEYITEELKVDLKNDSEIKKANKSVFAGSCSSFL